MRQTLIVLYSILLTLASVAVYEIADNNLPYAPHIWALGFSAYSFVLIYLGRWLEATKNWN